MRDMLVTDKLSPVPGHSFKAADDVTATFPAACWPGLQRSLQTAIPIERMHSCTS